MARRGISFSGTRYSPEEIEAIAGWLKDGISASQIAARASLEFGRDFTRNGIIGLVHRNKALKAIGFARAYTPRKHRHLPAGIAAPKKTQRVPNLHPGSIAAKRAARAPSKREIEDVLKAAASKEDYQLSRFARQVLDDYDATSRHVELMALGPLDCKFAVNDAAIGEKHLFCGKPRAPHSSYCQHHHLRCNNGVVSEARRGEFRLLAMRAS